ncbi:ankyrin repeat-containing domain protein [Phascolomyces articulosus]|uniref:Ankyrin repeat-containing domain protein n=1 Tax=Phascolomyces articulosus TaxID=60185 RepID=A0AAD5K8F7_9FUNG|nr:ankyrin repeat-containing domain protein [Phascolomyces articulosus]
MYTDNKTTDTPPRSHDHHHHNHGPLSNHSYAIHYAPSPSQHMSPALSEARRPGDVIRKTTLNRISSYHDRKTTSKQVTTKLKNLFVNNREREELMTACSKGDVDRVSHLLAHTKPNVNPDMVRDSKLRTPLLVACAAGKADVVRVLIRWGADVNNPVGDVIGNKPLDLAVISNNFDTVLALLEAGAHVTQPPPPTSMKSDDGLPAPVQQRVGARSPLSLAQSRLDLLITQRQNRDNNNESKQRELCMDQIVQIIKLLRYFSKPKEDGDNSSHTNENVTRELDELASKLSSIGLQEGNTTKDNNDDLEIMTSLRDVISKLHI